MNWEKKHSVYMGISVIIALVIMLLYYYTIFENLELNMLNFKFNMRTEESSTNVNNKNLFDDIHVIGIDDESIQKFGEWPLNRKVYADFINFLEDRAKPAFLFFDIFFVVDSPKPESDKALYREIAQNNNVIVDYVIKNKEDAIATSKIKEQLKFLKKHSFPINETCNLVFEFNFVEIPVVPVISKVKRVGFATIIEDPDRTFRHILLVAKFKDRLYPSIPFALLLEYYKVDYKNVELKMGDYVKLKKAKVPKYITINEIDSSGNMREKKEKIGYEEKDIVIPVDKQGRFLNSFRASQSEFNSQNQFWTFSEAMEKAKKNPSVFDDKLVMIGMTAEGGAHDMWRSPLGDMYGIFFIANAVNTVIEGDYTTKVPDWVNIVIMLFIALLLGFLIPRTKIWLGFTLMILLILTYWVIDVWILFPANILIIGLMPLLIIIFSFMGIIIYRILTEEKEKKFIKARFSNYVSAGVVDELLKNPKALQLGGENKQLTVLFSDVRSFTTISEKLGDPQKLVTLLNEYLGAMTDLIFKYDGTLDKYVGDEIMAFWGAPVPQEDHALKACRSALEQMAYLKGPLYKKWKEEGKPVLNIGIGINSGEMTVGNMGSQSRMDYTLMGDNVNLGARLEGTNKVYGTNIIISEFTYEIVKDKIIARELDTIRVKGKEKPVKIFELIAMKE